MVKLAILIDTEQDEGFNTVSLCLASPKDQRNALYNALHTKHIPTGLVHARDDFSGLDCIVAPSFALVNKPFAEKLISWVEKGGVVAVTAHTATRDMNNHALNTTAPGYFNELFGITVEEFSGVGPDEIAAAGNRVSFPAANCYEILKCRSAVSLAKWRSARNGACHAAVNTPAVTTNRFGKGRAIYIGTCISETNAGAVAGLILRHTKIKPLAKADPFVEITCRYSAGRTLLFVLNHYSSKKRIESLPPGTDVLSGKKTTGSLTLGPYETAALDCRAKK